MLLYLWYEGGTIDTKHPAYEYLDTYSNFSWIKWEGYWNPLWKTTFLRFLRISLGMKCQIWLNACQNDPKTNSSSLISLKIFLWVPLNGLVKKITLILGLTFHCGGGEGDPYNFWIIAIFCQTAQLRRVIFQN